MPTVNAKVLKGLPVCPECKKYTRAIFKDYGCVVKKGSKAKYFFVYRCPNCSTKYKKINVRYRTDEDFKLIR